MHCKLLETEQVGGRQCISRTPHTYQRISAAALELDPHEAPTAATQSYAEYSVLNKTQRLYALKHLTHTYAYMHTDKDTHIGKGIL